MTVRGYFLFEVDTGGDAAEALRSHPLHNAKQLVWPHGREVVVQIAGNDPRDLNLAAQTLSKVAGVRSVRRLDSAAPNLEATEWELTTALEKCRATDVHAPGSDLGQVRIAFLKEAARQLQAGLRAADKLRHHLSALDATIRRMDHPLAALLGAWQAPDDDDPDAAVQAGHAEVRVKAALSELEQLDAALKS